MEQNREVPLELRVQAVTRLLAGTSCAAELAEELGVSEGEVTRWRAMFLAGASAAGALGAPERRARVLPLAAAGAVCLVAGAAFSQANPFPVSLVSFSANTPAVASQVNGNFTNLKSAVETLKGWLDNKLGDVTSTTVTLRGPLNAAGVSATGAVSVSGALSVNNATTNVISGTEFSASGTSALSVRTNDPGAATLSVDGDELSSTSTLYVQHGGTTAVTNRATSFGGPVTINGDLTVTGGVNRYVVTARYDPDFPNVSTATSVTALNMDRLRSLCGDGDGCTLRLVMADFDFGAGSAAVRTRDASAGPFHFDYSNEGGFRIAESLSRNLEDTVSGSPGVDGDGALNHAFRAWNCFFTDGLYAAGASGWTDSSTSMYLLNWNAVTAYRPLCTLIIDD